MPPMLALADSLLERGHEVLILSQPSVRRRAEVIGCTFIAFSQMPDYEPRKTLEDQFGLTIPMLTGKSVGDDIIRVADRRRVDVVVVDANLAGGLAATETLDQPAAVLFHSMYRTFVDTWLADTWPFLEPAINNTRDVYGLSAVHDWPAVFAEHRRLLAVVPTTFDAPVANVPDATRHFGFLVPRTHSTAATAETPGFPPGDDPTVLVGLSTTYQNQEIVLRTIVEALSGMEVRALVTTAGQVDIDGLAQPPNMTIADYVPHTLVLDETDVMVTHAGLGSVASALSVGVPLVCIPHNRDQPLNAHRVADFGAGLTLTDQPTTVDIAAGIEQVLSDPSYRAAARALAQASREEGGALAAATELESLLD